MKLIFLFIEIICFISLQMTIVKFYAKNYHEAEHNRLSISIKYKISSNILIIIKMGK